jgi:hypothetical protein
MADRRLRMGSIWGLKIEPKSLPLKSDQLCAAMISFS